MSSNQQVLIYERFDPGFLKSQERQLKQLLLGVSPTFMRFQFFVGAESSIHYNDLNYYEKRLHSRMQITKAEAEKKAKEFLVEVGKRVLAGNGTSTTFGGIIPTQYLTPLETFPVLDTDGKTIIQYLVRFQLSLPVFKDSPQKALLLGEEIRVGIDGHGKAISIYSSFGGIKSSRPAEPLVQTASDEKSIVYSRKGSYTFYTPFQLHANGEEVMVPLTKEGFDVIPKPSVPVSNRDKKKKKEEDGEDEIKAEFDRWVPTSSDIIVRIYGMKAPDRVEGKQPIKNPITDEELEEAFEKIKTDIVSFWNTQAYRYGEAPVPVHIVLHEHSKLITYDNEAILDDDIPSFIFYIHDWPFARSEAREDLTAWISHEEAISTINHTPAHEFGHFFGIADRYHHFQTREEYKIYAIHTDKQAGKDVKIGMTEVGEWFIDIPMILPFRVDENEKDESIVTYDADYECYNNLYSGELLGDMSTQTTSLQVKYMLFNYAKMKGHHGERGPVLEEELPVHQYTFFGQRRLKRHEEGDIYATTDNPRKALCIAFEHHPFKVVTKYMPEKSKDYVIKTFPYAEGMNNESNPVSERFSKHFLVKTFGAGEKETEDVLGYFNPNLKIGNKTGKSLWRAYLRKKLRDYIPIFQGARPNVHLAFDNRLAMKIPYQEP